MERKANDVIKARNELNAALYQADAPTPRWRRPAGGGDVGRREGEVRARRGRSRWRAAETLEQTLGGPRAPPRTSRSSASWRRRKLQQGDDEPSRRAWRRAAGRTRWRESSALRSKIVRRRREIEASRASRRARLRARWRRAEKEEELAEHGARRASSMAGSAGRGGRSARRERTWPAMRVKPPQGLAGNDEQARRPRREICASTTTRARPFRPGEGTRAAGRARGLQARRRVRCPRALEESGGVTPRSSASSWPASPRRR